MIPDQKDGLFRSLLMNFRKSRKQVLPEIDEDSAAIESKLRIEQRIELALQMTSDSSPERRSVLAPAPLALPRQKPPGSTGLFVAEDYYLEAQDEGWVQEKRAAAR